jgi:hypothetical protein
MLRPTWSKYGSSAALQYFFPSPFIILEYKHAKKHTATAQNPGSQASPVPGDTCAAGSAQGRADFNSSGRLDQSIFDKHGTIFQDCYIKSFQATCLSQGNTEAACNDAQDA